MPHMTGYLYRRAPDTAYARVAIRVGEILMAMTHTISQSRAEA